VERRCSASTQGKSFLLGLLFLLTVSVIFSN
jgi:hypothetical protein